MQFEMHVFKVKKGISFHFVAINFVISKCICFIAKQEHGIVNELNRKTQRQAIKTLIYIQLFNCLKKLYIFRIYERV